MTTKERAIAAAEADYSAAIREAAYQFTKKMIEIAPERLNLDRSRGLVREVLTTALGRAN